MMHQSSLPIIEACLTKLFMQLCNPLPVLGLYDTKDALCMLLHATTKQARNGG